MMRNIGIWLVIGLAMMVLFNLLGPRSSGSRDLPFSDFISKVESGSVLEVVMRGRQVEGLTDANERFQTQVPNYPALFEILEKNQVRTRVEPTDQGNIFLAILNSWLPMLLIIGIWLFFMQGTIPKLIVASVGKKVIRDIYDFALIGEDLIF